MTLERRYARRVAWGVGGGMGGVVIIGAALLWGACSGLRVETLCSKPGVKLTEREVEVIVAHVMGGSDMPEDMQRKICRIAVDRNAEMDDWRIALAVGDRFNRDRMFRCMSEAVNQSIRKNRPNSERLIAAMRNVEALDVTGALTCGNGRVMVAVILGAERATLLAHKEDLREILGDARAEGYVRIAILERARKYRPLGAWLSAQRSLAETMGAERERDVRTAWLAMVAGSEQGSEGIRPTTSGGETTSSRPADK